jgi:uncharacterized protein
VTDGRLDTSPSPADPIGINGVGINGVGINGFGINGVDIIRDAGYDVDPRVDRVEGNPLLAQSLVFQNPEMATEEDLAAVHELIGRKPKTAFTVVVRRVDGVPVVTRNAPLEADGTPMPTRYWLLPSAVANNAIGRLESTGGVRRGEIELPADVIEAVHRAYAAERDAALPQGWAGPRPTGGVGGTRVGLKCLHAHYANYLAGNDDAIGVWVEAQLLPEERDQRVLKNSTGQG